MRKTLFISEMKISIATGYKYQAPYIFFQGRKWREDVVYFNDKSVVVGNFKKNNFKIV